MCGQNSTDPRVGALISEHSRRVTPCTHMPWEFRRASQIQGDQRCGDARLLRMSNRVTHALGTHGCLPVYQAKVGVLRTCCVARSSCLKEGWESCVEAHMVTVRERSNLDRVSLCIAHCAPQATTCLASILCLLCMLGLLTCVSWVRCLLL